MWRKVPFLVPWLAMVAALGGSGCQVASSGIRLLSFIGLEKRPLSVALVTERPSETVQTLNPFAAYRPLQNALSDHLGRPVAVDVCFLFQAQSGLTNGWYDLAIVTPAQFAALPLADSARVLVVSVDQQGRTARCALLLVAADSDLHSFDDLRGTTVGFGPAEDSRTHLAALKLLRDVDVRPADLALDVLPVPGSLRHFPDGRSVAQAVLNGSVAAGFVDEADWEALPESDAGSREPARDKLRVLGQTDALPTRLLVVAHQLGEATTEQVSSFLLSVGQAHPDAMEPLASSGYAPPTAELLAACRRLSPPPQAPTTTKSAP